MNNKQFLLREFYKLCDGGRCEDLLTEDEKRLIRENDVMFLTGVMQRADAENGNGRVYPREVLEREVMNYQKTIQENRAVGELDHPEESVINLKNVSHVVTHIWWQNNDVMGKIKILDTPSGRIAKDLIKSGVTLGISSRSLGSVHESKGKTVVEDDLQLICFDLVSEPSTKGAFMQLKEAKNSGIVTRRDKLHKMLFDIVGI
jgi:hypothetical protein